MKKMDWREALEKTGRMRAVHPYAVIERDAEPVEGFFGDPVYRYGISTPKGVYSHVSYYHIGDILHTTRTPQKGWNPE